MRDQRLRIVAGLDANSCGVALLEEAVDGDLRMVRHFIVAEAELDVVGAGAGNVSHKVPP